MDEADRPHRHMLPPRERRQELLQALRGYHLLREKRALLLHDGQLQFLLVHVHAYVQQIIVVYAPRLRLLPPRL